ncbi:CaiB/BaiF CoA transferase family protein [Thermodesulfobacteriota bacterium]
MAKQPFEGLKVADFAWSGAGPAPFQYLAAHGATVVRVESAKRPDVLRSSGPHKDGIPGINKGGFFNFVSPDKYGFALDMSHPKGPEIARRLVEWANILAEAYTPGIMAKWGLSYEEVRKYNPEIIYYSTCMMGQYGPLAKLPGFGQSLTSMAGYALMTGWPDRLPDVVYGANTDVMNIRLALVAILAALDYRNRTGKGQYLDLSQYEGAMQFEAPQVLDYTVNNRDIERNGNRDPRGAPHGVYRCQGNDKWCAITVFSDDEWRSFCNVIGNPEWVRDNKFSTQLDRKQNEDELDRLVETWTVKHTAEDVMNLMQTAKVAAGVVLDSGGVFNDPQLQHRQIYKKVNHPEVGVHHVDNWGTFAKLTKAPGEVKRPAPCLGEHTEYVCTNFLGMSDEEFVELMREGVFT